MTLTTNQMLEKYRDMKEELKPANDALAALGKAIRAHVLDTGELGAVEGLATSVRPGYTRNSWNSDKLFGYAEAHPEIMKFVTQTKVKQTVALVKHTMPPVGDDE